MAKALLLLREEAKLTPPSHLNCTPVGLKLTHRLPLQEGQAQAASPAPAGAKLTPPFQNLERSDLKPFPSLLEGAQREPPFLYLEGFMAKIPIWLLEEAKPTPRLPYIKGARQTPPLHFV